MPFPGSSTTGANTRDGRGKLPVFGQQHPILFGAAGGESAVGNPASGYDGVVTGRTQPSTEAAQHLVAQKPRHLSNLSAHVADLYHHDSATSSPCCRRSAASTIL
jgi:hypothetical protein